MPDLAWNKHYWDAHYDWKGAGEEWSKAWGGSEAQWFGSLLPRLHRFLPTENILEIAPGRGRWTRYLMSYMSGRYHGVDLSAECIGYCREVFRDVPVAAFSVNDGLSLAMVEDATYDLVFSFDSLVHVELQVHDTYIPQILAKLKRQGVAFIHHSNWAAAGDTRPNTHCRAESVSAAAYAELVNKHGGHVIIQEQLNWGGDPMIDAITIFCRGDRADLKPTVQIANKEFMHEAAILRAVQSQYSNIS